jgi:hypothetical protein
MVTSIDRIIAEEGDTIKSTAYVSYSVMLIALASVEAEKTKCASLAQITFPDARTQ